MSVAVFQATSVPAVSSPTRLRLPDLLHATDPAAADLLDGGYDHLLPPAGCPPTIVGSRDCAVTTNSTSG